MCHAWEKNDYNSQVRQEANKCRETLKGLTTLTYNIENVEALNELNSSLDVLLEKFTAYQTIDEKENSSTQANKKSGLKAKSSFEKYLPLPVRPKKNKFKNRVGAFATMMQNHYMVKVPVSNCSLKKKNSVKRKSGCSNNSTNYGSPLKKQKNCIKWWNNQLNKKK